MTKAPYHNQESFERAVGGLVDKADAQNRGADLDRVYRYVVNRPAEVNKLATIMFTLDDDFRPLVTQAIDAHRRWLQQKGRPSGDDDIAATMLRVYQRKRGIADE